MRVEKEKILAVVGKKLDYPMDFDFVHLVVDVIERALNSDNVAEEPDVALQLAIDDCLIWFDKQWMVIEHYQIPSEANLENACLDLLGDCYYILEEILEETNDER